VCVRERDSDIKRQSAWQRVFERERERAWGKHLPLRFGTRRQVMLAPNPLSTLLPRSVCGLILIQGVGSGFGDFFGIQRLGSGLGLGVDRV